MAWRETLPYTKGNQITIQPTQWENFCELYICQGINIQTFKNQNKTKDEESPLC